MSSDPRSEAELALRRVGRKRARQQSALATTEAELAHIIVTADKAGVPRVRIAELAGVVRATVYNVLGRA